MKNGELEKIMSYVVVVEGAIRMESTKTSLDLVSEGRHKGW